MRNILPFLFAVLLLYSLPALADNVERVSVASDGTQADGQSESAAISQNGRYVVFSSEASNLVNDDSNSYRDVFLHDLLNATTERVSIAYNGSQALSESLAPSVSGNGEWVAFASLADNLVLDDVNGYQDIFVRDREAASTTRVTVGLDATQPNSSSWDPVITLDGRFVAYVSSATNLVSGDDNLVNDVFIYDRLEGYTERVSVNSNESEGNADSGAPSISADRNYIAFHSLATNLVDSDTNEYQDIFIHDRDFYDTVRISMGHDGSEANGDSYRPAISSDGRFVAFHSDASNLVPGDTNGKNDVFVYDRTTEEISRVSISSNETQAVNDSGYAAISGEGNLVAFWSMDTTLAPGGEHQQPDIYIHDRTTGMTKRISESLDGANGNAQSWYPAISGDGNHIAFQSNATNLISGDSNDAADVFAAEKGSTTRPTPTPAPTPTVTPTVTPIPIPVETKNNEEIKKIVKEKIDPIVRGDTPLVRIEGRRVVVTFLEYEIVLPNGTAKQIAAAIEEFLNEIEEARRTKGKLQLRYRVKLKRRSPRVREVRKRTSSKNQVAYKRLKAGSYRIRYRVEIARRGRTVAKTGYSQPASFRIER